jgi:hypothetical protein
VAAQYSGDITSIHQPGITSHHSLITETGNVSETLNFDPQLTLLVARDVITSDRRKTGVHKFSKNPEAISKF